MYVNLRNQGNSTASDIDATISTNDSYVNFIYNTDSSYPDIPGGGTDDNDSDFDFEVASDTPDGHTIHFDIEATASNGGPWTDSFDIPVTCINNPPNEPGAPSPADGAADQGLNVDLSWSGGDADGDSVTYDVYFGTGEPLFSVSSDQASTTYDPGTLDYNTQYRWKIVAEDEHGATNESPVWDFTTEAEPVVGPLVYDNHTVDDDTDGQSNGNNDGVVNCGETVELYADLYNEGNTTATGLNATISTSDPYITFTYNTDSAYPDISGGGVGTNSGDFDFEVDPGVPDGHTIQFDLAITAGNGGPWSDTFDVVVVCPKPDLTPSQWGDWQYPVVPSSITDTNVVNTLYAEYATYIDWGLSNQGNANTGGSTYGALYLDDVQIGYYDFGDVSAGQTWAFFDWVQTVDEPGWHTLKSVADPDDLIDESDETNNTFERDFYWTPVAPYVDDMENGTNDWSATGMWHQVDDSSPYPESHSGVHSWWYGQDSTGNYDTGITNVGNLTSPPIYIPDSGHYLRFWYRYETEAQSAYWDQRKVQISVDDGPFYDVLQLYDDPMNHWLQSPAIDLSGYAGHIIQVRFQFDTLDNIENGYRGWYVDDVEISTTPPPSCGDTHEPNDSPAGATSISYGQSIDADICAGGDYDFYQFSGDQGDKVAVDIDAMSEGSSLDPYIYLLNDDGSTVLAQNDDEITAEVRDSLLDYQLPYTGTYYVKVKAWDHPSAGSADHFYTLHLLTDDQSPSSAEMTAPSSGNWLDPQTETVTVSAVDDESGVNRVEFLWHSADWENSDWVWLGADYDGRDGWSWPFDTASRVEQEGGAFYAWAFDWANNWTGASSWNLGIDHTPPDVTPDVYPTYGDAPFRDFWVNWWYSYDNLSGIANYDVQYRDGADGNWTDLVLGTTDTYTTFVGADGHTYYFRVRARDNAGNLSPYSTDEVSHTVDICSVAADAYESDDGLGSASRLPPNGASQIHNFHTEEDTDWVKFTAQAGVTYTLATANTGDHADTVLELYDADGSTLLAENDDCAGRWPASCLDWQAPSDGTYYVKVYHWDQWAYGCTTEYGLSITSDESSSFTLGEPGTSFRYQKTFGTPGEHYLVDGGHLNGPNGVSVDDDDNLWISEWFGHRALKYNADGAFQMSIGDPGPESSLEGLGDVDVAPDGSVWIADADRDMVIKTNANGEYLDHIGVEWEAGSDNDHFNSPLGLAFDSIGNLYVSDSGNHRVQVFDSSGAYVKTIGVSGESGSNDTHFNGPDSLFVDQDDNLYVADAGNHRVQIFDSTGAYSTTLGTGTCGSADDQLCSPSDVAVDTGGAIYVADTDNHRVQIFDTTGVYQTTLGESGIAGSDKDHFDTPEGVAVDAAGTVYVSDWNNLRVQVFDSSLDYVDTIGKTGQPYTTNDVHFNHPADIAADGDGAVFLAEGEGHRVLKLDTAGTVQDHIGTAGIAGDDNAHFNAPSGLAVNGDSRVYVADRNNHRVQVLDGSLNYLETLGTGECSSDDDAFCGPHKVAADDDGNLYMADTWNDRVQVFDAGYNLIATLGVTGQPDDDNLHFEDPRGVAVDSAGHVYVADEGNARVQRCTIVGTSGECDTFVGETGTIGDDFAHLRAPLDVAVDAQDRVYVVDSYWNQRVQVFDDDGAYLTTINGEWGGTNGDFRNPEGIGIAPDGTVYVADTLNARIQTFAPGVPDWQQVNIQCH
jgi:uncharacterized protein YjiK